MSLRKRCDCEKPTRCEHPWHYDFRVEGRRYRDSTKTSDVRLARDFEAVERTRALQSAHNIKRNTPITLGQFWPLYLERHAGLQTRASTQARSERIARVNVLPRLGNTLLGDITAETLGAYAGWRLGRGARPATVNRELALVSSMLAKAVEWGYLLTKPKTPLLPLTNARTRVLSQDELDRLLAHLQADPYLAKNYYGPVALLAITGAREMEVLNLRWEDWDGRGTLTFRNTKTGRDRTIAVTPEMGAIMLFYGAQGSEHIFPQRTASAFLRTFKAACKAVGIEGVTVHTLRHTAATRMLVDHRVDARTVQEILGWKTLKMLQRYTHPSLEAQRRALGRMVVTQPAPPSDNYSARTDLPPAGLSRNHANSQLAQALDSRVVSEIPFVVPAGRQVVKL